MKTFLILYQPGPAWIKEQPFSAQPLQEHGKYILQLYREGRVQLGGPFDDDSGGAVLLEADSLSAAQAIAEQDPAVLTRIFNYRIYPWTLLPWEQYLNPHKL